MSSHLRSVHDVNKSRSVQETVISSSRQFFLKQLLNGGFCSRNTQSTNFAYQHITCQHNELISIKHSGHLWYEVVVGTVLNRD